jgi:hypothetical protein
MKKGVNYPIWCFLQIVVNFYLTPNPSPASTFIKKEEFSWLERGILNREGAKPPL